MKATTRIAIGCSLACALLLVEAASAAEPQRTRSEQLGLTRGTQGLVPTYRIWAAEMVDSPIDFRQLKPGAKVPKLPPVFFGSQHVDGSEWEDGRSERGLRQSADAAGDVARLRPLHMAAGRAAEGRG